MVHAADWCVSLKLGNNQTLTRLVETGDLQPLQNLNQLTDLNLQYCENLIGQSVSEFVRAQLRSSLIGGLGDLQALQNLNQLTYLNLQLCGQLTGAFR